MATEFNTQVGNGEYRLQFETEARRCVDGGQMTNADRIRSMSNEELVRMLTLGEGAFDCFKYRKVVDGECDTNCPERCLDWLQRPAEENNHAEDHA